MEQQIKAFNEIMSIYYELLEVVGTTPSHWNSSNDTALHQFPVDIEFIVDVEDVITNILNKKERYLIDEFFFFQDLLNDIQKIQFNTIQLKIGKVLIEKHIYPASKYNKKYIN